MGSYMYSLCKTNYFLSMVNVLLAMLIILLVNGANGCEVCTGKKYQLYTPEFNILSSGQCEQYGLNCLKFQ